MESDIDIQFLETYLLHLHVLSSRSISAVSDKCHLHVFEMAYMGSIKPRQLRMSLNTLPDIV